MAERLARKLMRVAEELVEDPDDWGGEDQAVDAVEHAAVAGEKVAGIFYVGAAFVGGFDQVAGLAGDICGGGDDDQRDHINLHPAREEDGDDHGGEDVAEGAFPGFLGTERGAMFTRPRDLPTK